MTGREVGDVYSNVNSSLSAIGPYFQEIMGLAEENSARSQAFAREQMDFNSLEAAKNRDWQEYMSNTAHQREVADLQAAGLNPVLSASGGNGAAVTSGATASGASGTVDNGAVNAMVSLLNNAINADVSLEESKNSALTNLAVSEKQAQSAQLVQALANDQSFKNATLASDTNKAIAIMNNAQSDLNSQRQSHTSRYNADRSYQATIDSLAKQLEYNESHPQNWFQALTSTQVKDMFNDFPNSVVGKLLSGLFGIDFGSKSSFDDFDNSKPDTSGVSFNFDYLDELLANNKKGGNF